MADNFAGRRCSCARAFGAETDPHLVHSEGLREHCDVVVDFGANVTARHQPRGEAERALVALAPGLQAGTSFHVKSDHLGFFFTEILPRCTAPVVLVSGDSDYGGVFDHRDVVDHPRLFHWFAQNADLSHPRVTPVPIGFDNPWMTRWDKRAGFFVDHLRAGRPFTPLSKNPMGDQVRLLQIAGDMPAFADKPRRVLCTFHQFERFRRARLDAPGREPRLEAANALGKNPLCYFPPRRLPQATCWQLHAGFAFEAAPHGKGLDCFRTWEALLLGTVPIVKTSPLDALYRGAALPVLILSAWTELTPARLQAFCDETPWNEASIRHALSLPYWTEKISIQKRQAQTARAA